MHTALLAVMVIVTGNRATSARETEREDFTPRRYSCEVYTTCALCVQDQNCAWCASDRRCTNAGLLGVSSGLAQRYVLRGGERVCDVPEYKWCSVEDCHTYSECTSCAQDPFCGWCSLSHSCAPRYNSKPLSVNCAYGFFFDPAGCPAHQTLYQGAAHRVVRFPRVGVAKHEPVSSL